mgnify:CR=1
MLSFGFFILIRYSRGVIINIDDEKIVAGESVVTCLLYISVKAFHSVFI